jgi:hypothetical protein
VNHLNDLLPLGLAFLLLDRFAFHIRQVGGDDNLGGGDPVSIALGRAKYGRHLR